MRSPRRSPIILVAFFTCSPLPRHLCPSLRHLRHYSRRRFFPLVLFHVARHRTFPFYRTSLLVQSHAVPYFPVHECRHGNCLESCFTLFLRKQEPVLLCSTTLPFPLHRDTLHRRTTRLRKNSAITGNAPSFGHPLAGSTVQGARISGNITYSNIT